MANQKPKKSGKKNTQPEPKKDLKETKDVKETKDTKTVKETTETTPAIVASSNENPMKGFFARKYGDGENILTIFKTPKIWGALLGEVIGTFLITAMLLLLGTFGLFQYALYLIPAVIFIYVIIVKVSSANFNPLITAGMMASRRMSAIRGVLYMLAQLLGAWLALIVVNAFRLGSETSAELPVMNEVTGETFWAVALIELIGAIILAFCFARAIRYSKRSALTFSFAVASSLMFVLTFGATISQGFFQYATSFTFNPVVSLMYQILPTAADNFGELAQMAGLAIAAYVIFPVIGGVLGFYLSDTMTRLAAGGYMCECDSECGACKK